MQVALDGRMLYRDRAGIGRYIWELQRALARLPASPGPDVTLLVDLRDRASTRAALPVRRVLAPSRHALERLVLPAQLRRYDVAHFPDHGIPPGARAGGVVTVHDLSFLNLPDTYDPGSRAYYGTAIQSLVRAGHVIADSEYVRQGILERRLAPESPVTVVHLAPTPALAQLARDNDARPRDRPYCLIVATIQPRKNLVRAAAAFVRTRTAAEHDLLIVGALGYRGLDIVRQIRDLDRSGRIQIVGRLTDERMSTVLRHARLVLIPSLEEGFGLPAADAMALGVPCVVSDAGALPEVTAGAARLVDPFDPDSIAAGVDAVASDDRERQRLIDLGLERAAELSWSRTAAATAEVYREAA